MYELFFLEFLVFIPFSSTVYQTGLGELENTLHHIFSLFYQPIQQISFWSRANAFIFLNLRVARVIFVQEGFKREFISSLVLTDC